MKALGHVADSNQSEKTLNRIFKKIAEIKDALGNDRGSEPISRALRGNLIVSLFNQPSTRTRLKLELGGEGLGAKVIVINEITHTSVVKGEDWYNTLRSFSEEGVNVLTIRHPSNYIPQRLAKICDKFGFRIKIVNGGDGKHLHPTQGIGDTFTIKEHFPAEFGKKRLKVALGADLRNGRVAHSLVKCLSHYPIDLTLVSWQNPGYRMPRKYLHQFIANNGNPVEVERLPEGEKFDVIYWFRYQIEHGPENEKKKLSLQTQYNEDFRVTPDFLDTFLKEDGVFLHPGPRTKEIDVGIDADPRVKDGEQMRNGRFASMAIFLLMLNPNFRIDN